MENHTTAPISMLFEKTERSKKATAELLKPKAANNSAAILLVLLKQSVIAIILTLFVLAATVGMALWIGSETGTWYYGFFIMTGFYLLLSVLLFSIHKTK